MISNLCKRIKVIAVLMYRIRQSFKIYKLQIGDKSYKFRKHAFLPLLLCVTNICIDIDK